MHLSKPFKNMNKKIIGGTFLLIAISFYWFQVRPAQARKDCIEKYPQAFGYIGGGYSPGASTDKFNYEKCLREHGLKN